MTSARRCARVLVLVLLVLPSLAVAQRGGMGRGGGGRRGASSEGARNSNNADGISNGDVEEMSPIKLLIDKRKDLKLTDAQVHQFKDLESAMKKKNEPFFKSLDSLRDDMKPRGGGAPSEGQRARLLNARARFGEMVDSIRANYNATLDQATPLLDETQRRAASDLVKIKNDQADDLLDEKLRRGGPGAGRRPPVI